MSDSQGHGSFTQRWTRKGSAQLGFDTYVSDNNRVVHNVPIHDTLAAQQMAMQQVSHVIRSTSPRDQRRMDLTKKSNWDPITWRAMVQTEDTVQKLQPLLGPHPAVINQLPTVLNDGRFHQPPSQEDPMAAYRWKITSNFRQTDEHRIGTLARDATQYLPHYMNSLQTHRFQEQLQAPPASTSATLSLITPPTEPHSARKARKARARK